MSVPLSFCLSVCLSVCRSLCLSVCLSLSLCLSVSVSLSLCFSVCLFVCQSLCLSVCLSVCLSQSLCPSLCLSVSVSRDVKFLRRLQIGCCSRQLQSPIISLWIRMYTTRISSLTSPAKCSICICPLTLFLSNSSTSRRTLLLNYSIHRNSHSGLFHITKDH